MPMQTGAAAVPGVGVQGAAGMMNPLLQNFMVPNLPNLLPSMNPNFNLLGANPLLNTMPGMLPMQQNKNDKNPIANFNPGTSILYL